ERVGERARGQDRAVEVERDRAVRVRGEEQEPPDAVGRVAVGRVGEDELERAAGLERGEVVVDAVAGEADAAGDDLLARGLLLVVLEVLEGEGRPLRVLLPR